MKLDNTNALGRYSRGGNGSCSVYTGQHTATKETVYYTILNGKRLMIPPSVFEAEYRKVEYNLGPTEGVTES